jgi:superfamily II DNA helicase RecQ
MKNGSIDILVATKAFGVGVNIPDIRHVIHMGIPQNLSCLVQESGRAGRGGHQAHSYVMLCEYQDMTNFQFWITSGSQEKIETLHEDYVQIWVYLSAAFTGSCLCHLILDYFNDYTEQKIIDNPQLCCTGCVINATVPKQKCELQVFQVLKCISTWESKLQQKKEFIHENIIVEWLAGKDTEKIWRYFNDYELDEETSFGFFAAHTLTQTELIMKGLLRQCLSLNYVISLLEDDSMWILVEERRQYEMLGFFHDPSKLLFVEDCSKLIAYPLHEPRLDFMWKDINLTECSSFAKKNLKIGEEELV